MKKSIFKKVLFSIFLIGLLVTLNNREVCASNLSSGELLIFKDYTIKNSTTIDEIIQKFGEPKAVGKSAFGGNSYSFCDDEYTWYLHIETNSAGTIKGFGCIEGDFTTNLYTYGDTYNSITYSLGGGVIYERSSYEIFGVYGYNCSSSEASDFWTRFAADSEYLYDLQKHSVIVSKILAKRHNYDFPQTYISEELFYAGENLKTNGTDLYNYGVDNGKTDYISLILGRTDYFYSELPNPILLGKRTEYYTKSSAYEYIFYDVKITKTSPNIYTYTTIMFINPSFYTEQKTTVEFTESEMSLLDAVKQKYEEYLEDYASYTTNYEEEPVYDSLPLSAGKWTDEALALATDYINLARVGLGIGELELDSEITEAAQYKATLVYYVNNALGEEAGHDVAQPDGVDDEFYAKAQSYMNENLYQGNIQTSIIYALNDASGDPITCGHRYNLLDPSYTKWGVGSVGSGLSLSMQAAQKFSGSTNYTNELVAWPSNGIFPMDLAYNGIGNWTAQFYKNYKTTSSTYVTVECLNSGKVYEITSENSGTDGKFLKLTSNYLVTFRDDNITYENGDVFEITLHNMLDSSSNTVDYTYRSVFLSLSQIGSQSVTDIDINREYVKLNIGQSYNITAIVEPEDATNKLLKFTSSDESVATVRQDGKIEAVSTGTTTVTIVSQDSTGITKQVTVVVVSYLLGDMNLDGKVNAEDAAIVLDRFKNNDATDEDYAIGDLNSDGKLNAEDAAMILDIYKNS